ncbi:hypothetical protein THAOC_28930, partial [Thalassiosira oceanica]
VDFVSSQGESTLRFEMVFLGRPSTTLRADRGDVDSPPVENRRRSNPPSLGSAADQIFRLPGVKSPAPSAGESRAPQILTLRSPLSLTLTITVSRLWPSQAMTATTHSPLSQLPLVVARDDKPDGPRDELGHERHVVEARADREAQPPLPPAALPPPGTNDVVTGPSSRGLSLGTITSISQSIMTSQAVWYKVATAKAAVHHGDLSPAACVIPYSTTHPAPQCLAVLPR